MKNYSFYLAILLLSLASAANAQNDLRVPLTNPGQPGKLVINTVFSDEIIVRTHPEEDVLVQYEGDGGDDDQRATKNGMRRISSGGVGLEVVEDNNEVRIKTGPMPSDLELMVLVPKNFSLNLNTTQGDVEIHGLEGELEINAVNGDIKLKSISGSVILNSVNGDIEVDFLNISPDVPMSFTGVNGDIEIALPTNAKFSAKMKTEWGDIYTNFDMEIDRSAPASEVSSEDGKYKVAVNKWVLGEVNGGGPEFVFKTLRGDISIRKKE